MKTDDKRNHAKQKSFYELKVGDTFEFDGMMLMKIPNNSALGNGDIFMNLTGHCIVKHEDNKLQELYGFHASPKRLTRGAIIDVLNTRIVVEPW